MVLLENGSMFSQQSLLLLLDYLRLSLLLSELLRMLLHLFFTLSPKDRQLSLPKSLDFTSVLQLAHSPLLSIHLLKTLIRSKLLQKFLFEILLKSLLLGSPLRFESHLELLSLL